MAASSNIVSDESHRRGKPRIKGTGITVQNIVEDTASGLTPEYISEQFGLTLGQVYAALSYYYDHKDEIDRAIEADKSELAKIVASEEYRRSQEHAQQVRVKLDYIKSGKP
jgi:uncharacterized protein (DUF433 family)